MSIFHKYNVVFIEIPKNASTSIFELLKSKTDKDHKHTSYLNVLKNNDFNLFFDYLSFSCIRDPYDRFVSIYEYIGCYKLRSHKRTNFTFDETIYKLYNNEISFFDISGMYLPQYCYITLYDYILVDKIIRFENLENDWYNLANIINKNNILKYNVNNKICDLNMGVKRNNRHWSEYYTNETKNMIYNIYKKDFEMFGYEK